MKKLRMIFGGLIVPICAIILTLAEPISFCTALAFFLPLPFVERFLEKYPWLGVTSSLVTIICAIILLFLIRFMNVAREREREKFIEYLRQKKGY